MIQYKLCKDMFQQPTDKMVERIDGEHIMFVQKDGAHWDEYQAWLAEGNE